MPLLKRRFNPETLGTHNNLVCELQHTLQLHVLQLGPLQFTSNILDFCGEAFDVFIIRILINFAIRPPIYKGGSPSFHFGWLPLQ